MIYFVEKAETKGEGWKILTLKEAIENGQVVGEASINKIDKKTGLVAWPNFDEIVPGSRIEGDIWRNPAGKLYLFAPKTPSTTRKTGFSGTQVEKLMDKKVEGIRESQERKEDSIAKAGAFRDATLISLASLRDQPFPTDDEYKVEWIKWVKWILSQGDQPFI